MSKILQYYVIPSGINKEIADVIIKTLEKNKLQESKTFANSSIRSSKNFWVAGDSWIGGMMAHFINAAKQYVNQFKLKKKSLIIDIGSNDGIALKPFKDLGYNNILGIEPAKNLAKLANKNKIKIFLWYQSQVFD